MQFLKERIAKGKYFSIQGVNANDYYGKDKNGLYTVSASVNNKNFPAGIGILEVIFGADIRGIQRFIPIDLSTTPYIYVRTYNSSWSNWFRYKVEVTA